MPGGFGPLDSNSVTQGGVIGLRSVRSLEELETEICQLKIQLCLCDRALIINLGTKTPELPWLARLQHTVTH